MFEKLQNICNGYTNLIKDKVGLSSDEEVTLYNLRENLCDNCEFGKGRTTCGKCGCLITAKVKCKECSCPENYWSKLE